MSAVAAPQPPAPRSSEAWKRFAPWIFPIALLTVAYSLLGLTQLAHPGHADLMRRCVLMDEQKSRIWSVAHIEIGLAYFGVFGGMVYFVLKAARAEKTHLRDMAYGVAYVLGSFCVDLLCVAYFQPFEALLVGDIVILAFTLAVSRQLWFQRLLGVFVPLVFLSCALGHFMEGLSFWQQTYHLNVPWTMVTADIGFAVLANASRFPAFIRGADVTEELARVQAQAAAQHAFLRDVLAVATEEKLFFCASEAELPEPLPLLAEPAPLKTPGDVRAARHLATRTAGEWGMSDWGQAGVATLVGEAAANAMKHAPLGEMTLRGSRERFQIWIKDSGEGIPLNVMPRAILEAGFSTAQTLGQGFSLILGTADRVDLLTGAGGTTLVMTLNRETAETQA